MVRWQKKTNTLRDTVTIQQPIWTSRSTSLKLDVGLLRNMSTELYHVLIMLTRGRAQRLVQGGQSRRGCKLIAISSDDMNQFQQSRHFSKLVDLLATTFIGDLIDSLTYFDRIVTSWEHEATGSVSDLIKIEVVIRMHEIFERDRKTLKKQTSCTDGFVRGVQSRSKVPRKQFTVWNLRSYGARLLKENRILARQPIEWMVWHGRRNQRQAQHGQGQRQARTKERVNKTARKGRKDITRWRGTKTRKKHKPVKNTQSGHEWGSR